MKNMLSALGFLFGFVVFCLTAAGVVIGSAIALGKIGGIYLVAFVFTVISALFLLYILKNT